MSEPVIEVRHLSKSFGTHVVLRDVDFTVNAGDVTCIIGASGSGKSTLLRCINLLETPTNGKVLFHGSDITATGSDPCAYRAKVGMVFQSFNLFNNMTVLDNCTAGLRYVLHQDKETAKKTALENLEKVGMAPYIHAKPRQLSGGQKQRVAIARALSTEPRVLLCDEATSALDPETTDSILGLIRDINKRLGITAVVITHEMDVIEKICSKVAIISKGVIAETGTVNEVFFHPRSEIARRLVVPEALHPDKMKLPKLYRLIFDGQSSFDPVVSNMVLACGKPVNIMYASTQDIGGTAFGQMVLQLPEDEESIARIQAYVKEHGLYLEEFTHA